MRPFTVLDVAQRSPEWHAARLGRLTGSVAGDILATVKTGEAAARRNLRLRLVLERLTGRSHESSDYVSPAMQAGIQREADAIAAYEAEMGVLVQQSGFLQHGTWMAGCSLDGHLGDFDALVSVKCRQPAAHLDYLRAGTIPSAALAQMRHEAWITAAREHYYVTWNPDFPPRLRLRVRRLRLEELDVPTYEAAALAFLSDVDKCVAELSAMAGQAEGAA